MKWYNDTWIFDLTINNWIEMKPETKPPSRDSYGIALIDKNKVIIFGGKAEDTDFHDDTWMYNLINNNWNKIETDEYPERRASTLMTSIGENYSFLLGGWQFKSLDDNWLFDFNNYNWNKINSQYNIGNRKSSAMVHLTGKKVIVFGGDSRGDNEDQWSNDTWVFNLDDTSWTELEIENKPERRYLHNMAKISEGKVLLFGGILYGYRFNDTWLFTYEPTSVSEYIFDENNKSFNLINKNNEITINYEIIFPSIVKIDLFNINGIIIDELSNSFENEGIYSLSFSTEGLTSGLYFIRAIINNKVYIEKIIITK